MTSPLHSNQPGLQAAMEKAKNRRASHVSTYAPTPPPFDFDSPYRPDVPAPSLEPLKCLHAS